MTSQNRAPGAAGLATITTYTLMSVIGAVAFLYPFWQPVIAPNSANTGHAQDAPLMTALLISLCLIALALDAQRHGLTTKTIALLGVLVALNSVLRFIEVSIPGPAGFTPIFFLIILCGYVFGARFGFLMGVLSLLVSALITGGVGPWLPYQMFTAGWMGLSAGWLGALLPASVGPGPRHWLLIAFGALWGFLYGLIINVWFWPFAGGAAQQSWQPGQGLMATLQRYAVFYIATSLVWDAFGALGNAALIAFFGRPTLRTLLRFRQRFTYVHTPGAFPDIPPETA